MIEPVRFENGDTSVPKKKVKKGTASRALKFAGVYTRLLVVFLLVVIADSAIRIANPLIYRDIINNGILRENSHLIIQLALLVGLLSIFDAALGLTKSYFSAKIGSLIVLSLRSKLFDHIQRMPLAFFAHTQTGSVVSRLNTDVSGAQNAFTDILSNVVGNVVTVTVIVGTMVALSWQITLLTLALLPVFIISARFWGYKLQAITRESYDLTAAMNSLMVERFNVAGAQLAMLFGRRNDENEAFKAQASRVSDIGVKRIIYSRIFFAGLILLASFASALAYGWGGILAVSHKLDVGTIVALVSLLERLYGPLMGLSNIPVSLMAALVSFERVFDVLDLQPTIQEQLGAVAIRSGPARITFEHVSFHYPPASKISAPSLEFASLSEKLSDRSVLRDISFAVEPGELLAIVGPSGAGKTTITQLVPRLYDVQSGSVSINGIDVRAATLDSLRQRIGVVTQDPHLFHDTIRANLLYAKPKANDTDLHEALRAAQILPLILSLPKRLDTLVGERGYRFSGGEKQRLAIARVLLKAPEIVILDEATAHLDSESEAAIQKAFEVALAGRTSIVIAHRLSTILNAAQILVVEGGIVVQRGTHLELLARSGLYAEMYHRQFSLHSMVQRIV